MEEKKATHHTPVNTLLLLLFTWLSTQKSVCYFFFSPPSKPEFRQYNPSHVRVDNKITVSVSKIFARFLLLLFNDKKEKKGKDNSTLHPFPQVRKIFEAIISFDCFLADSVVPVFINIHPSSVYIYFGRLLVVIVSEGVFFPFFCYIYFFFPNKFNGCLLGGGEIIFI